MKTKLIFFFILTIQFIYSQNQQDTSKIISLNEIEISANRIIEKKKETAQSIKLLTNEEIVSLQSQTSADLIQNSGAAFVQKSQQGGGSPVLRGFEASRVLLVIDGVRMNNLIYRSGHLQNIITTDNNAFEKVEILYGPSSTIYGSDALGGVIHMYTKNPVLANDSEKIKIKATAFSRYGSANEEKTHHIDFNIGLKKFASWTSFTHSDFGDLMMGKNANPFYPNNFGLREYYADRQNNTDVKVKNTNKFRQVKSGYQQYDLVQKLLFQQNQFTKHILNIQYSNSSDVPRYDRLTEFSGNNPKFAEWYYGPQKRLMTAYDFQYSKKSNLSDFVRIIANYQSIEESRHTRRFNNKNKKSQIEQVNIYGLNLDAIKKWQKHHLQYGLDIQYNTVKSTAKNTDITTGTESPADTRYPDGGNQMTWASLYLSHKWFIQNEKIILTDGLRIGKAYLHSLFNDTTFFKFPFKEAKQNNWTYSGSIGIINNIHPQWKLSFLISSGFRVPNVDDLGKVFDSQPGAVIVPNPNIQPEKTINEDISIQYFFGKNSYFSNTLFYTQIFDAIVTDKFQYNGQDSILYNGVKSQVLANQNKQQAYIYGFSSEIFVEPNPYVDYSISLNYTYGRIKTDSTDYPLDHIPPLFGKISFRYKPSSTFTLQIFSIFNGAKQLKDYNLFGEDNLKYAPPTGTPAWFTLNFRIQWKIWKYLSFIGGIDNIFDTQYRTFASGINAPGRNLFGSLKINF
ncbi:MAG: TonB-dependent receptor [Bacteroidetes bacterium]|nr:MAG: TonB-dependent receptor [Bacteroidota bacterium]